MATTTPTLARQGTPTLLPAIVKLGWWRFKQMRHVLLFTWLGMLSMVMLVCIGYAAYAYLSGSFFSAIGGVKILLGLLALIAPLLILAAGITLFLLTFSRHSQPRKMSKSRCACSALLLSNVAGDRLRRWNSWGLASARITARWSFPAANSSASL
jgi:uncharacterized membrane protein